MFILNPGHLQKEVYFLSLFKPRICFSFEFINEIIYLQEVWILRKISHAFKALGLFVIWHTAVKLPQVRVGGYSDLFLTPISELQLLFQQRFIEHLCARQQGYSPIIRVTQWVPSYLFQLFHLSILCAAVLWISLILFALQIQLDLLCSVLYFHIFFSNDYRNRHDKNFFEAILCRFHFWTMNSLSCPHVFKNGRFTHCKLCYYEHWGIVIILNYGFLQIYAQEWDCWIIW